MARRSRRGTVLLLLLAGGWLLALSSCGGRPPMDPVEEGRLTPVYREPPAVRVALALDAPSAQVGCRGPYRLEALPGRELLEKGDARPPEPLRADAAGLAWGDRRFGVREAAIIPENPLDGTVTVDGVPFPGSMRVIVRDRTLVTVVNHLDLETYLSGVLGSEVPLEWPLEAIKAQAVAARTYALYRIRTASPLAPYDLTATTESQVYGGWRKERTGAERARLRAALSETRGQALTFAGRIFQANYHAVCGGHTDPAWMLVGGEAVTPLRGVPCDYCRRAIRLPAVAAKYRWAFQIPEPELRKRLRKIPGWAVPEDLRVAGLSPIPVGPGGHAGEVEITLQGSRSEKVPAKELRAAIGWEHLLSPAFTAVRKGDDFLFEGKGWGHGGGMCQWGVWAMAHDNFTASEILLYYYPGSEIEKLY